MTYDEARTLIDGLEGRPWRAGLDRMRAFVDRAGLARTLDGRGYVHVAGTNGKGTTTAFVESILRRQGWRTGAFYSPYVVDYRERIQANGDLIPKKALVDLVARLGPTANAMSGTEYGGVTKFELEAALGLAYWEDEACEWVALEVGLGGRLDATNVVRPRACAIVSIGLDHTSVLGSTLEEIAAEKAGIVKAGVPVVVGEVPPAAMATIRRIADERGSEVWRVGHEVLYGETREGWKVQVPGRWMEGLRPSLAGERTPHNMAVALAAVAAAGGMRDPDGAREGVRSAWLPGRFDTRRIEDKTVICDGAHNADAAAVVAKALGGRRVRLVTNMVAGHEAGPFYATLAPLAAAAEVSPILSPRALSVPDAMELIARTGIPARGHESIGRAMAAALDGREDTIVVTGSNYLVGEALRLLD